MNAQRWSLCVPEELCEEPQLWTSPVGSTAGGKEFIITQESCGIAAASGSCASHVNINYECGACPKDCGPGLVCAEGIRERGANTRFDICVPEDECGRDIVYYAWGGPPEIAFAEYRFVGSPSCTQNRYDDELSDLESDNDDLQDRLDAYEDLAEGYNS